MSVWIDDLIIKLKEGLEVEEVKVKSQITFMHEMTHFQLNANWEFGIGNPPLVFLVVRVV